MEGSFGILLVLITLAIICIVQAQDQRGFISLDCGLSANETSPYKESPSGVWYSSDKEFIQSGKTGRIRGNPNGFLKKYLTLRYFPEGIRNCYILSVEKGRKYVIGAGFLYGNYDGLGINPVFDLYLGPNPLVTIDFKKKVNGTYEKILHTPTSNSLQICLVKTGETTPLINSLDLRPMGKDSYITKSGSLKLVFRRYFSQRKNDLQYPDDVNGRIWNPYFQTEWTQISTTLEVDNSNKYVPPRDALKQAATPTNASAPLKIEWTAPNPDDQFYFYAYFAEIQDLQANETREFDLIWNGLQFYRSLVPMKLGLHTISSRSPQTCDEGKCSFQLIRTNRSTLPPLLNALEVYRVIQFPQSETDESDVDAIKDIAATYALSKINWQGDPCVPQQLRWDGLNCNNADMSMPPRITSLNLSSSGLAGTIAAALPFKVLQN